MGFHQQLSAFNGDYLVWVFVIDHRFLKVIIINSTRITTTDQKLKFEVFSRNLFHFNIHDLYCDEPKEFFNFNFMECHNLHFKWYKENRVNSSF